MLVFAGKCATVSFDEILTTERTQDTEGFSTVLVDENGNVLTTSSEAL